MKYQSKTTASGWIRWRGGSIIDTAWEGIHIARPEPGARITIENLELARNAVHMTSGGAWKYLRVGMEKLQQKSHLQKMNCVIPSFLDDLDEALVLREDEFALQTWKLTFACLSGATSRLLYYSGWPHRMACIFRQQ